MAGLRKAPAKKPVAKKETEQVKEIVLGEKEAETANVVEASAVVDADVVIEKEAAPLVDAPTVEDSIGYTDKQGEAKEEPKKLDTSNKKPGTHPQVKIKLSRGIRTYIGNQWYEFRAGEVTTVPAHVKEILQRARVLDAV